MPDAIIDRYRLFWCYESVDSLPQLNFDNARIQVANMAAYRNVLSNELSRLPALTQTHSYFVIEEVKEMAGITIPKLVSDPTE